MKFKAGSFQQTSSGYKAFQPEKINRPWNFDDSLITLVEQANHLLGTLNAYGDIVPDVAHFIRLYVVKEATLSSRIEGTQTNMEEALLKQEEVDPEKRNDWLEVNNYIEAMNESIAMLDRIPLSSRLFKHVHKILMQGVVGNISCLANSAEARIGLGVLP